MRFLRSIWNSLKPGKAAGEGKKFWQFVRCEDAGEGDPEAELLLYGVIGDDEWWDDVTSKGFAEELKDLGDINHLRVRINSPGGDVFAAQAIHNLLKQHAAKITVNIDGWAASAASIVAMAGDEVIMPGNTMLMIHNPWTIAWGDAREMRKTADVLDQVREGILAAYQGKSGMERQSLINLMNAETWMTAEEAKEKGFIDTVTDPVRVAACARSAVYKIGDVEADLSEMPVWPGAMLADAVRAEEETADGRPQTAEDASEDAADGRDDAGTQGHGDAEDGQGDSETPGRGDAEDPETEDEADPVAAERDRLRAIDELAAGIQGIEDLVNEAKYGKPVSAEQFAVQLLKSGKVQNGALLAARRKGAQVANVPAGSSDLNSDERSADAEAVAAAMKRQRGIG